MEVSEFLTSNLWIFACIALVYLLVSVIITILRKIAMPPAHSNRRRSLESLKRILIGAPLIEGLSSLHLRLVLLSFNWFLFLVVVLICGHIQTGNVVVPTDEIVDSSAKLLSTKKTLLINSGESDLIMKAPERSFLKKLNGKQFFKVNNLHDLASIKSNPAQYVNFFEEAGLIYGMSLMSKFVNGSDTAAFVKSASYYERLAAFPVRKKLDEERKRFIYRGSGLL